MIDEHHPTDTDPITPIELSLAEQLLWIGLSSAALLLLMIAISRLTRPIRPTIESSLLLLGASLLVLGVSLRIEPKAESPALITAVIGLFAVLACIALLVRSRLARRKNDDRRELKPHHDHNEKKGCHESATAPLDPPGPAT